MGLNTRFRLRLAVIFAAIHFFVVGMAVVMSGGGGEALAFVFVGWDAPLLGLCQHIAACAEPLYNNYGFGITRFTVYLLLAGTVMYAIAGFVVGAAIDGMLALIARRRS